MNHQLPAPLVRFHIHIHDDTDTRCWAQLTPVNRTSGKALTPAELNR
jgi:hypothetical protein